MGIYGLGFEFRVELRADKPGMARQFYGFHEVYGNMDAAEDHAAFFEGLAVTVRELVAVTVPLHDRFLPIDLLDPAPLLQRALISPETHGAPHAEDNLLVLQEGYDRVRGRGIELL